MIALRIVALMSLLLMTVVLGCSSNEDSPAQPPAEPELVSEVGTVVDTIQCLGWEILAYELEDTRVVGDLRLAEFRQVTSVVRPELVGDERLLTVSARNIGCVRTMFDSQDVYAQTLIEQDSTGTSERGRYFSFTRQGDGLKLWEVGEWSHP